jgi:hypothetical protein
VSFAKLVDYLLWSVYVREQAHPEAAGAFFDLRESAKVLDEPPPPQLVYDAARVLETQGLIRAIFALGGYAAAALTGEGRLKVERELADEGGGSFAEFKSQKALLQRLQAVDAEPESEPDPEDERAPIFDALEHLSAAIGNLPSGHEEKQDLLADVETMRVQLRKHEPNAEVIAGLLEPMRRHRGLASPVSQIIALLYP